MIFSSLSGSRKETQRSSTLPLSPPSHCLFASFKGANLLGYYFYVIKAPVSMGASFTIYSSILNDKKGLKNGETTYLLHQLRLLLPVSTESTSFLNFVLAAQISQRREKTLERACDPSSHSLWCWKSGRAPENSWLLLPAFAFTFEPSHFFLLSNFFSLRVVNQ